MRCWTRTAKDGHKYTNCEGNTAKSRVERMVQKRRKTMTPPTTTDLMPMSSRLSDMVNREKSTTFENVASILRMTHFGYEDTKKMRRSRPPNQFNQFSDSAEYKRKVNVPPRSMSTRGKPIDDLPDVSFEDLGEISEEEEEEQVKVIRFEFEGESFLKDKDDVLYDPVSQDVVGRMEKQIFDSVWGRGWGSERQFINRNYRPPESDDEEEAPDPFFDDETLRIARALFGVR